MKLRCDRKELQEIVGVVGGVTASRGTRPILQHILFKTHGPELELLATDLEVSLRCRYTPLLIEEQGTLALPAGMLAGILREAPGETIDLSTDGNVALLRSARGQFRVSGENPADFPEVAVGDAPNFVDLPAPLFRELAERTEFAASRELGRYAIDGILLELDGKTIRMVSTDGRRLALAEATLEQPVAHPVKEIVPLKGVTHFLRALGPNAEVVGLHLSKRRALLRCGNTVLSATSRDAEFPDYRGVVPADDVGTTVQLDRDNFFGCVRQVNVMAGDDAPAITLTFSEGSLVLAGKHEGRGDARSEMPVDYIGPEVKISFNPAFLLDFGKKQLPEKLPFSFRDSTAACVFRPAAGFAYVVMPMSL
ncbi:MAG: DNA polymerase III subunit beta [Planctomycetes bacterium]|nr:DNA polymerase III subunit beta [Planctomycetota bacterium]